MTMPPHASIRDTRRAQVFPRLDERQLADLLPFGERRRYPAGATLFAEGERHVGMFVVLAGAIDIVRRTAAGEELLATHEAGVFSGEVALLAGRAAVASGRARGDCEALLIDEAALHRLMVTHAELSEIIMRAFILRRVAVLEDAAGGVTLIGSRLAGHTHRLRQFLTRNGQRPAKSREDFTRRHGGTETGK